MWYQKERRFFTMRGKMLVATALFLIAALFAAFYVPAGDIAFAPARSEPAFEVSLEAPGAGFSYITELKPPEVPVAALPHDSVELYADDDAPDFRGEAPEEPEPQCSLVTITVSAAGDVTLGGDPRGSHFFLREFSRSGEDHGHFLRGVRHIFEDDDLTIVNLEGALTEATEYRDKTYAFRGPPHFAQILSYQRRFHRKQPHAGFFSARLHRHARSVKRFRD
jgi:hypothetical protein